MRLPGLLLVALLFTPPGVAATPDRLLLEAKELLAQGARTSQPRSLYDEAGAKLRQARALAPASVPVLKEIGSLYAKTGRTEESLAALDAALVLEPGCAEVHATRGYVLRYAGCFGASIAAYQRAMELDPSLDNRIACEDQIAKTLIYLGDTAGALATHDRLRAWLGADRREPDEKMLFYRGMAHLYAGQTREAVACFHASQARDPESLWGKFAGAYRAIAINDRALLRTLADELAATDPVDGERHYRLVHFYAELGDQPRALAHLRTTLRNGFFAAPYIAADSLTVSLHDTPGFRELLAQAQARHASLARRLAR